MESGKPPIILTVSGLIGSGKTSVCRELSKRTGWRVESAGTILRRMAEERGVSVMALNEIAKTDSSIDKLIDDHLISLRESPESLIVDSRLAWHFIPNAYKIHLVVDTAIAADRVFRAQRIDESYATPAAAYAANAQRQHIENVRFQQYYQIDCEDWRNYDLILDSSTLLPEALAAKMQQAVEMPAPKGTCWLSPSLAQIDGNASQEGEPGFAVREGEVWALSGVRELQRAREAGEPLVTGRLVDAQAGSRSQG
jgi:cytidylate kinase